MKKLLPITILTLLLTFVSCTDDDPVTPEPTLQEIQQDIKNTFNGAVNCLSSYENGQFSVALQDFFMINNGEIDEAYSDFLVSQLDTYNIDLENFSMVNHSGVYNWNSTTDSWNYTSNSQNMLIFNFPFLETGTTNNMKIIIEAYEVQELDLEYYPTKLIGTIEKDGFEIHFINLDNVTYQVGADGVFPTNFDLEIRTMPMTHYFDLEQTSSNQFKFNYASNNNGSCKTNFNINASTLTSDYTTIEGLEDFSSVTGNVSHDMLNLVFTADTNSLNMIDEPTVAQINQYTNVNVLLGNSQIGHLEYEETNDTGAVILVHNNGTRENADAYVNETLANEIEAIFSNYTTD